jgi:hypothetical protein
MKVTIKAFIRRIFHIHDWSYHVVNMTVEGDVKTATIGWKDCHKCGASKLLFIYG